MQANKKLKQRVHRMKKEQRKKKELLHLKKDAEKVIAGKARTSEASPYVGLAMSYKQAMKGDPRDCQKVRKLVIEKILGTKVTKHSSRLTLWDYRDKDIIVEGYIADVKPDSHIVLLDHPYISYDDQGNAKNRLIDSHIWLNLDYLQSVGKGIRAHQEVAIGDRLIVTARVKAYKGKIQGSYGYRYGLVPIKFWACGVPFKEKGGGIAIASHYPRLGDWVLRFKYLPGRSNHPMEIEYQKSNYPSYIERMHLPEYSEVDQEEEETDIS